MIKYMYIIYFEYTISLFYYYEIQKYNITLNTNIIIYIISIHLKLLVLI